LLGCALAGCARDVANASQPLLIGGPVELREPLEHAAQLIRTRHPEVNATVVAGTPTQLAEMGLPFDVIAADSSDGLVPFSSRLWPGERRELASNPMVLVARSSAPTTTKEARFHTLPGNAVKAVAIADGRADAAAEKVEAGLGRLGLRRALNDKLRYFASTDEVLAAVERGEVELGLALYSDVGAYALAHPHALDILERSGDAHARYPIAILQGTLRLQVARELVEEVVKGDAQRIVMERHLLRAE
jgi:ABC-type molybdate transport system substrate-binding protein